MLWMILGNFASKMLNFLLIPLYTNCLSTEQYGTVDLLTTTINLLTPILTLSIGEAVLRFALDAKEDNLNSYKHQVFSVGIFITTTGTGLLLLCSPVICNLPIFNAYYWYFFAYYLTQALYIIFAQFAKGTNYVFAFSLWGIVNTFTTALLNILFILWFQWGIEGYLLAFICGQIITDIGLFFHVKAYRYLLNPRKLDKKMIFRMLLYALPMVPNNISWWITNSSNRYIITAFLGDSENGIYSIASKLPAFLTVIFNMFIMAWQISSVEDFGNNESKKFFSTVNKNYIALCAILSSGLIVFIKPIAKILFAKDFYVAWKIAPILLVACCFHSLALFLGTIYTAAKQTKRIFYSTVGTAILNILLNLLLVPLIGSTGAALATLVSYLLLWLFRAFESRKMLVLEYNIGASILSAIIIFAQTCIVCCDLRFASILSAASFLVVCLLNREFFITILGIGKSLLKRNCIRKRN